MMIYLECVYCHGDIDPQWLNRHIGKRGDNICQYCYIGIYVLERDNK